MAITEPGLLQLGLGAENQYGGAADGDSHLAPGRIERRGAGRIRVSETVAATGELLGHDFRTPASAASSRSGASVWASSAMRSREAMGDRWPLERDTGTSV